MAIYKDVMVQGVLSSESRVWWASQLDRPKRSTIANLCYRPVTTDDRRPKCRIGVAQIHDYRQNVRIVDFLIRLSVIES